MKKATPYICCDAFYELLVLLMDEYGLYEANKPTEALLLFQETLGFIYNLLFLDMSFKILFLKTKLFQK